MALRPWPLFITTEARADTAELAQTTVLPAPGHVRTISTPMTTAGVYPIV